MMQRTAHERQLLWAEKKTTQAKRRPGVVTTWKMASHRQAGSGRRDALLRSQCYEPVCFGLALPAPPPCGESARGESGLLAPALSGRDVSEIDSEAAE